MGLAGSDLRTYPPRMSQVSFVAKIIRPRDYDPLITACNSIMTALSLPMPKTCLGSPEKEILVFATFASRSSHVKGIVMDHASLRIPVLSQLSSLTTLNASAETQSDCRTIEQLHERERMPGILLGMDLNPWRGAICKRTIIAPIPLAV
ncbi:hypothetical protein K474DRAFT_1660527 [Panus rudis PR-1116 ss-1]|nr:hypothetical protein K474DRAFT_1660527 [Panus rudis PR-1116 ss-1]